MAVSVDDSGAQVHTLNTEHTLSTRVTAGAYQLLMDFASAASDEAFEIRIYTKVRSGDTERQEEVYSVVGPGSNAIQRFDMKVTPHDLKFTSKQLNGVGRTIPWAVYKL